MSIWSKASLYLYGFLPQVSSFIHFLLTVNSFSFYWVSSPVNSIASRFKQPQKVALKLGYIYLDAVCHKMKNKGYLRALR